MNRLTVLAAGIGCTALSSGAFGCSSCGCTLNSDWSSQGYTTSSGLHWDLRYDYFDQSELRSGTRGVSRSDVPLPAEREVQQNTINRNLTLGLDYSPARNWGVNVLIPYFDRPHTTYDEGETELSGSHSRGLGDVRVVARYQGFQPDLSIGVQFGLKLPTGEIGDTFRSGPLAGETVDRGLQLGTGTTDLLLGVYTVHSLGGSFAYLQLDAVEPPDVAFEATAEHARALLALRTTHCALPPSAAAVQLIARDAAAGVDTLLAFEVDDAAIETLAAWPSPRLAVYSTRPDTVAELLGARGINVNSYSLHDALMRGQARSKPVRGQAMSEPARGSAKDGRAA